MAIFLDDVPITVEGGSLGEVIQAAQRRIDPAGRLIMEVRVGGQCLAGAELAARQGGPLPEDEVRLYSEDPRELAQSLLAQLGERLGDAGALQREAAELFQQGQAGAARLKVGQAMAIWEQVQDSLGKVAALASIELDDLRAGQATLSEAAGQLSEQLRSLHAAIAQGDGVAAADALAYEWPGLVEQWGLLLKDLSRRVGGR